MGSVQTTARVAEKAVAEASHGNVQSLMALARDLDDPVQICWLVRTVAATAERALDGLLAAGARRGWLCIDLVAMVIGASMGPPGKFGSSAIATYTLLDALLSAGWPQTPEVVKALMRVADPGHAGILAKLLVSHGGADALLCEANFGELRRAHNIGLLWAFVQLRGVVPQSSTAPRHLACLEPLARSLEAHDLSPRSMPLGDVNLSDPVLADGAIALAVQYRRLDSVRELLRCGARPTWNTAAFEQWMTEFSSGGMRGKALRDAFQSAGSLAEAAPLVYALLLTGHDPCGLAALCAQTSNVTGLLALETVGYAPVAPLLDELAMDGCTAGVPTRR